MNSDRFPSYSFFRSVSTGRLLALLPALGLVGLLLVSALVAMAASPDQSRGASENLVKSIPSRELPSISWDARAEPSSIGQFGFAQVFGEVAKLTAGDAQAGDRFGDSVSISGNTIVVGARWEDGGPGDPREDAGAAYVFERNEGGANNWGQVVKLTAGDAQDCDPFGCERFGSSVSMSGDTIVIGASEKTFGFIPNAGAAYVFERNHGGTDNWGEVAKLTASDAQEFDNFGISVSMSGDTIVVGSRNPGEPYAPLAAAGAAYVFGRDHGGANNWGEVAKLTASDAQSGDGGWSVSISGDTIVVGAGGEDGGPGDPLGAAGAAYVFERDEGGVGNWGEVAKLTASDARSGDVFGSSVAISADTIVVGALQEDGGPGDPLANAGAVYIFGRDQGGANNWGEVRKLTASDAQADDSFGGSVSVNGDSIAVGAAWEDGGPGNPLEDAGATYAFIFLDHSVYLPLVIQ